MRQTVFFLLIVVLFFTSCIQEVEKKAIDIDQIDIPNEFIGNWVSLDRVYPYKAYLIIKSDSTFHFEYGACSAGGFSNGKWVKKDSIIILNSIKTDSCMYLSPFGQDCILIEEIDRSEFVAEKTIPDCNPKNTDDYIEFKNEEFYINNDTLIQIVKKPKLCPEIRNDFTRIIQDTIANKGNI